MAIEREIPKDIKQYEPKLLGPFTTRQILCLVPAAILSIAIYLGLANVCSTDVRLFLIIVIAVPFILTGWYKPYNLPFEKFVKSVFISVVISPPQRKYKTERYDFDSDEPGDQQKSKPVKSKKKKKITDPNLRPYQ